MPTLGRTGEGRKAACRVALLLLANRLLDSRQPRPQVVKVARELRDLLILLKTQLV